MSTAQTYGFWIAIAFAAVVWFLPTIIAVLRGLDGGDILIVLTLNLIVVGWPAAMIGAFFPKDRLPPDRGRNPYYTGYWDRPPVRNPLEGRRVQQRN